MAKHLLLFALLFGSCLMAQNAAVFTGLGGDRKWDNPANWSINRVPGANDEVVIPQDKTVEIEFNCKSRKLTIDGRIDFPKLWNNIYTDNLIINKTGYLKAEGGGLRILPNTNQLYVRNEGEIYSETYLGPVNLQFGEPSNAKDVHMEIVGGSLTNVNFNFYGKTLDLTRAQVTGLINIDADFLFMREGSELDAIFDDPFFTSKTPIAINCSKRMVVDKRCRRIPRF